MLRWSPGIKRLLRKSVGLQKPLNMHLHGKKMSDDLHDLGVERDSLREDNEFCNLKIHAQWKEIEEKDREIRARDR